MKGSTAQKLAPQNNPFENAIGYIKVVEAKVDLALEMLRGLTPGKTKAKPATTAAHSTEAQAKPKVFVKSPGRPRKKKFKLL